MRYPNGTPYSNNQVPSKRTPKKNTYSKRGMALEEMINRSNQWYLTHDIAIIHKKPTPIQVVTVDYPKRSRAVIREAYYRQASTTDYNGVYKGHYIDFEAKQTDLVKSFPLSNIHPHQIKHMQQCVKQGGLCFLIVYLKKHTQAFLYPFEALIQDWEAFEANQVKSIPIKRIQTEGFTIPNGFQPQLDYIAAVDYYMNKKIEERSEDDESTSTSI